MTRARDISRIYKRTAAEIAAGVTPTDTSYPAGDVRRYGAVGDGVADDTAAITAALSVIQSVHIPDGEFATTGGHTVLAKQSITGNGIGRSTIKHTATSGTCLNFPSYSGSESSVQYGGQTIRDLTIAGTASTDTGIGIKIKNQTDICIDHVEIKAFQYGISGVRDNAANSCTDITVLACRIIDCAIGIYAPRQWNGFKVFGGVVSGNTWSIICYDSNDVYLNSVFQCANAAEGAIFLGGCAGYNISGYFEGDGSSGAFVKLSGSKDVAGNATLGGIAISASAGGQVTGASFSSGTGIPYCVLIDGAQTVSFTGNSAGSGISTALARLLVGTARCFAAGNNTNPGMVFSYQTDADAANNVVLEAGSRVVGWGGSVAAIGSLILPYDWNVFLITGTSGITSISAPSNAGRTVTLIFEDVLTVTDGSNLKLAGNFTTSANDTLQLTCDGTNWYEVSRSAN
jgi:hypothetical protein